MVEVSVEIGPQIPGYEIHVFVLYFSLREMTTEDGREGRGLLVGDGSGVL